MPDASSFRDIPLDWADAFERLPMEAPEASAWPAMSASLREHQVRRTRRRWMTLAAAVAAVVSVPVLVLRADLDPMRPARLEQVVSASEATVAGAAPARTMVSQPDSAPPIDARVSGVPEPLPAQPPGLALAAPSAIATVARTRRESDVAVRSAAALPAVATPAPEDAGSTSLASLQTESAQLERLLALARDERVASGVTVALRDAQLERIASIDAALVDDIDPAQRAGLWEARVDALRDATAFEGNRRWREAQGLSMDAALVRVD